MPQSAWSTLDNAAKAFVTMARKYYSTFFRIEFVFHDIVIYPALKKALELTLARYSIYQVKIRRGFFWYFFEPHKFSPKILSLTDKELCGYEKLLGRKATPLWKVLVYKNRIALEFSHIITDGIGGLEFAKTLVCTYYECVHNRALESWEQVIHPLSSPHQEEFEYGYKKYFNKIKNRKINISSSFHYPDKREDVYKGCRILVPLDQLKDLTRSLEVSITEYITALHLFSVQKIYCKYLVKKKGTVRDIILINLRKLFPSKTLRNFFWIIMAKIDFTLGYYSFEEILRKICFQLKEQFDPREIQKHFSDYVDAELLTFNRIVPRWIKNIVIFFTQLISGESINTSSVSNLGNIALPEQVQSTIQSAAVFPIPSKLTGKNFNIISINNTLCISSAGYIHDRRIEREMALSLKEQKLDITFLDW